MSTRCNIIIKDEGTKLFFYRHSDGYPESTGESLKEFVKGYSKHLRDNVLQSAGWLIIHGYQEQKEHDFALSKIMPENMKSMLNAYSWKVGSYEPTDAIHGDIEFLYEIDLVKKTLTCWSHNGEKKGKLQFTHKFKVGSNGNI